MADYHDATGEDLTLSTPKTNETFYYFLEGVLGLVEGPGENGNAPTGVWNFTILGPAKPKPFTSLANQVPPRLTRVPYWRKVLIAGILAEVWDEFATQADDATTERRYMGKGAAQTARYEKLKRDMWLYVNAQMIPTRPIRSDI